MEAATLKQLRSLAAVAQHGSISAAARALHVSPPAVGQQIRLLEKASGIDLVVRTPKGLRLTPAGTMVLDTARKVETELQSCADILNDMRDGTAGRVTLGAVSTAKYFAPHLLAPFREANPGIDVSLRIGNRAETIAAIEALDVDVFITGRAPSHIEVIKHEIGPHPHVVVAHPDHHLASQHRVDPTALADDTFLLREPGSGTRAMTEQMLATFTNPPRIGMEIASNETIKQAVMAGLGLALLSWHTVWREVDEQRLTVLDIAGTPILRTWQVMRHAHATPSPAAQALWDYIAVHGSDHLPADPA